MLTIKKIYDELEKDIIEIRKKLNPMRKVQNLKDKAREKFLRQLKIGLFKYMEIKKYDNAMKSIKPIYDTKTKQTLLK